MARMAMLVSPELCIGCRACQSACKEWKDLPAVDTVNTGTFENPPDLSGSTYNKIRFLELPSEQNAKRWLFVSQRCMHCMDAGCMKICPSPGALFRTGSGAVAFNKDKCIGCRLCASACPFGLMRFDGQGKASKCDMCPERTAAELAPACVKTCPTGALKFGGRGELAAAAAKNGYAGVYGGSVLGGTGVLYAFRFPPKIYEMAENPAIPAGIQLWSGLKALSAWGLGAALAASALHYLATGSLRKEEEGGKKDE